MVKRNGRLNEIINRLRVHNGSTIQELAYHLDVSDMTVRRDLKLLEDQGYVRTFHGSVVYNRASQTLTVDGMYSVDSASMQNASQKLNIGRRAAEFVEPDDIIIIDLGSTAEALARALPLGMPLTIVCYGLNILREISRRPDTDLYFAGGHFHEDTLMFEGDEGIDVIKRIRATKAFISAAGVNLRLGVTTVNPYESKTKRAALESSLSRILIADSSKFGRVSSAYFADLSDFDTVITDAGIDAEHIEAINKLGLKLIFA
jgi:DeoR family transcriptional regulator, deoxyribose operon repressor